MSHRGDRPTTALCHSSGGSEAHRKSDAVRLLLMQSNNNRGSQEYTSLADQEVTLDRNVTTSVQGKPKVL
jgi:hypothetical protein